MTAPTRPYRPLIITAPAPGRPLLACRCGKAITDTTMRIVAAGRYGNGDPKPGRVVCPDCARNRAW